MSIQINNKKIGQKEPVFIVAEIGKNFIQTEAEQSIVEYLDNAKALVKAAFEAGADAVKFQTHEVEDEQLYINVVSPHFTGLDRYRWVWRNTKNTPLGFWYEIKKYCDHLGIVFHSTPMSRRAAQKLETINTPMWKVGSGDILDFVTLDFMASTGKPIILSSGMSTLKELDQSINFLKSRTNQIVLLHCVSKYPCPPEELNLGTIEFFQKRYSIPVGFSDHSLGHESAVAAANMGAVVIEKHFSFARDLWGADHKVSMAPDEFKTMVQHIRQGIKVKTTNNYGRVAKILHKDEAVFRPLFRKSLMAGQDLLSGTKLSKDMIYAMRPQEHAGGLPSEEYENVLGKALRHDLKKFDPITWDSLIAGKKRKICFIITSRIHYSRSKILLEELNNREDVELQIVIGASAILERYGDVQTLLEEDGFDYVAKITMSLEGGSPVAMAKTTGVGITEFATLFDNLRPDIVLLRADRYEVLAAAVAAAYLNITIAHIEGGDVSGTIDESVRHAITKLSHIHLATNEASKKRIIKMGEHPDYVFNVGCPELEFVAKNDYKASKELVNRLGVGDVVDISKPYLIVMQHSVTSEVGDNRKNIEETLSAIKDLGIPTIWFWPNIDAGTDEVSKAIRIFREHEEARHIRFHINLPPEEFIALLKGAACLIGNSSAGIKESSYLGVPVVNIGTRQKGRLRVDNVLDVGYNKEAIKKAIKQQVEHGQYPASSIYCKPNTANKIIDILTSVDLYTQKRFVD